MQTNRRVFYYIGLPFSWLAVIIIKFYQLSISPLLMPACRYTPSCSQYGIEALRKYGFLKGMYLTIKRVGSCHPWGGHGHDPVP
jgi:uncharacterized protein